MKKQNGAFGFGSSTMWTIIYVQLFLFLPIPRLFNDPMYSSWTIKALHVHLSRTLKIHLDVGKGNEPKIKE